jgi:hypothetical protein
MWPACRASVVRSLLQLDNKMASSRLESSVKFGMRLQKEHYVTDCAVQRFHFRRVR